ncbi:hypothetical protein C0991_001612, partial [Blastosporella zonata]
FPTPSRTLEGLSHKLLPGRIVALYETVLRCLLRMVVVNEAPECFPTLMFKNQKISSADIAMEEQQLVGIPVI